MWNVGLALLCVIEGKKVIRHREKVLVDSM